MPKREPSFTPEQRADTDRLRALWQRHQLATGTTQEAFAELLHMSQGGLNHYLRGRKALGLDAVLKFSTQLGVSPTEISPSLVVQYLAQLLGGPQQGAVAEPTAPYNTPALSAGEVALIYETRRLADKLSVSPEDLSRKVITLMRMLVVTPIDDAILDPAWNASNLKRPGYSSASS